CLVEERYVVFRAALRVWVIHMASECPSPLLKRQIGAPSKCQGRGRPPPPPPQRPKTKHHADRRKRDWNTHGTPGREPFSIAQGMPRSEEHTSELQSRQYL